MPLKETVVFPESMTPLAIGQERSIKLIDDVVGGDRLLALIAVKNDDAETPGWDDLYEIGTAAVVHKMIRVPDGTLRILVQGIRRIRLERRVLEDPYLVGEFVEEPDQLEETKEVEALTRNVQSLFARIIAQVPYLPEELQIAAANVDDPSALCHLVASTLRLKTEEKQKLLELVSVDARLREVSMILNRELEVFELGTRIQSQVQSELEKGQREFFLRQQMKAIQDELGESDPGARGDGRAARAARGPRPAGGRLRRPRSASSAGSSGCRPQQPSTASSARIWTGSSRCRGTSRRPTTSISCARGRFSTRTTSTSRRSRTGSSSTSRCRSSGTIRRVRFSASSDLPAWARRHSASRSRERSNASTRGSPSAACRDEAEIRGHRRTYIGAMPGSIIRALRDAESMNPVLLVDEIDKMGSDVRGDPSSAMLEVLDPEQNKGFRDHYLDLPFDLSKVLFICTANTTDTIPGALLDRMDVISLSGYTEDEKLGIAKRYLVPKQVEAHGLKPEQFTVADKALRLVIREYTREAGVRGLERRIADLCRKAARKVAEGYAGKVRIDARRVRTFLGPRRFSGEVRRRTADAGVATGLAYTAAGGDVLFIEAQAYPGKGQAAHHRSARRGDAGVGAGRALLGALAHERARHTRRRGSPITTCTCTYPPARCRRTDRPPA